MRASLGDLVSRSASGTPNGGDFYCAQSRPGRPWVCFETDSHDERWFLRLQTALAGLYGISKDPRSNPGPADGKVGPKTAGAALFNASSVIEAARRGIDIRATPTEAAALAYLIEQSETTVNQAATAQKADILAVYFERLAGAQVQAGGAAASSDPARKADVFKKKPREIAADAEKSAKDALEKGGKASDTPSRRNRKKEAFWRFAQHTQAAADGAEAAGETEEATGEETTPIAPEPDPDIGDEPAEDLPDMATDGDSNLGWWLLGIGTVVAGAGAGVYAYRRRQLVAAGIG